MNILIKIILSLIAIGTLVFLLFFTFITSSVSNLEEPYYEKNNLGLFKLNKNSNNYEKILIDNINNTDKVIFSSGSIEKKLDGSKTIITLTAGIYLFDLEGLNSDYIIKGIGFEINNKGPGIFIINNLNSRKNIIFSVNSLLDLNLKHYKTNDDITNIDLYPHTYLIFNPLKNIFVKNSDLLKISQTFTLGYFNEKITNKDIVSKKFIDLISLKDEESKSVINSSMLYIKQEYLDGKKEINNFLDSKFQLLPGENFIMKYSILFINNNKKNLYYKNIIIRNLFSLLSNNEKDIKTINLIVSNFKKLEKIDKQSALEIKDIINYYYKSITKSNSDIITRINFGELISKIYNNEKNNKYKSLILLEKIFFKYDYLENTNFYNEIGEFRKEFFNDLNVDITGIDQSKSSIDDIERVDYILYFLENLLLTSDFASSNINTTDLINMFNDYVEISNSFYSYSNEKIKRTGLFTNSKILNKFISILENKYFNINKNENGLLELKENIEINKNDILLLEKNINNIFSFYNDNKKVLKGSQNNKDKFIIKLYSSLYDKYNEYFFALKYYKEYLIKYDKIKTNLLSTNTVNENNKIISLSIDQAKNYLKTFNGIDLQNTTITIMDYSYCSYPSKENELLLVELAYCYKIENLNIDSKNVSFLLHPFNSNKIDEISIDNIVKSASYKLDEIKKILDEKVKTQSKDKEQFNFANFLVDTFGNKQISKTNIGNIDIVNEIIEEDPIIKIFKRNKLFGDTGDFVNIEGFLTINYKDLIVQRNKDEYLININLGIFNISLLNNNEFYGRFKSEYNFLPKHSFINPELLIIDKKNKKNLLLGNNIYIIGEYKVNNIAEEIKNLFNQYTIINSIINNINQITRETNIKITYIKESDNIIFETNYKGGTIYIKIDNGQITKAKYNDINKLKSVSSYTNLPTILNNIIN